MCIWWIKVNTFTYRSNQQDPRNAEHPIANKLTLQDSTGTSSQEIWDNQGYSGSFKKDNEITLAQATWAKVWENIILFFIFKVLAIGDVAHVQYIKETLHSYHKVYFKLKLICNVL